MDVGDKKAFLWVIDGEVMATFTSELTPDLKADSPDRSLAGGLLGLEKGTNCGPTSLVLWLSRADMAKKKKKEGGGGLSRHYILPEGRCHSLEC